MLKNLYEALIEISILNLLNTEDSAIINYEVENIEYLEELLHESY